MKEKMEKQTNSNQINIPHDWMYTASLEKCDQIFIDDTRASAVRNIIVMFRKSSSLQGGLTFSLENFNDSLDPVQDIKDSLEILDQMVSFELLYKDDSGYTISELLKSHILELTKKD